MTPTLILLKRSGTPLIATLLALTTSGCGKLVGIQTRTTADGQISVDASHDGDALGPRPADGSSSSLELPGDAKSDAADAGENIGDAATPSDGASSDSLIPSGRIRLLVLSSGKCLDTRGSATAKGNPGLTVAACDGSAEQTFALQKNADGTYLVAPVMPIVDASGPQTGCLDVEDFSTKNAANIIVYQYAGTANQKWILNDLGDGYFKLSNKLSSLCLDAAQPSAGDPVTLQQWDCRDDLYAGANRDAQRWKALPAN